MERRQRRQTSNTVSSVAIHVFCKYCCTFGIVIAVLFIGMGLVALLVTSVKSLGGNTILWRPDVQYYGRILGGVSWAVGTVLLIICYKLYGRTEENLISWLTRYRRRRRYSKSLDNHSQTEAGAMGDTVIEETPVNVTMSDIPLVGVSSDHSVASHHMTIESWLNKKFHGKSSRIPIRDQLIQVHHNNVCANNNTDGRRDLKYPNENEISVDWQSPIGFTESELCAGQEYADCEMELCISKFTQTEEVESETILHHHFSPPKIYISGPKENKSSQTSPHFTTQCATEVPEILGSSPKHYTEVHGDNEVNQKMIVSPREAEVSNEAFLQAVCSIDTITEACDQHDCAENSENIDFDDAIENSMELTGDFQAEDIVKTLDRYNICDDITPLSLIDYDESISIGDASDDMDDEKNDSLPELKKKKEEHSDEVLQVLTNSVEVYPVEAEHISFTKARSSRKSISTQQLTRSKMFDVYSDICQNQSGGGDTEGPLVEDPLPTNDSASDKAADVRAEILTPDLLISACDQILDSHCKRRAFRESSSSFSKPNEVDISSPENIDKDSSSSSGFSEGACASDGSLLAPSAVAMVHTLSESYVSTPTSAPKHPVEIYLEPPEAPGSPGELNRSCNSNSPEKGFPLQITSANTDLLSAADKETTSVDTVRNGNDVNANTNNTNRNNNLAFASKSDCTLASSTPCSGIPPVSSSSSTSFLSTTTDSTMYSAQDTLSFNTVVDSDDDYQDEFLFPSEFDGMQIEEPDSLNSQ